MVEKQRKLPMLMCMRNAPNSGKQNMNMYNRGVVRHLKLWVLTY